MYPLRIPIFREVRPASLPEGDFTSPYRARGEAIKNGQITDVDLLSPGASYNLPPKIIFEGDGSGAPQQLRLIYKPEKLLKLLWLIKEVVILMPRFDLKKVG